jgi:hypothetical protein
MIQEKIVITQWIWFVGMWQVGEPDNIPTLLEFTFEPWKPILAGVACSAVEDECIFHTI